MSHDLQRSLRGLEPGDHLCLLYEDRDEQLACAVPYVRDGLERGERCLYILDERTAEELEEALSAVGIDVARQVDRGALRLLTKRDTYLASGGFDPDLMMQLIRDAHSEAQADGYPRLRVTGEMTWALGPEAGTERLIEYEARLNDLLPEIGVTAICQYNRHRFSPGIVRQVLHTHPLAILGDRVCTNLYYQPPEWTLGEAGESEQVDWMIRQLRHAGTLSDALRHSEKRYRSVFEASRDGIFITTPDGEIVDANPACLEMLGRTREELLSMRAADNYVDPAQRQELIRLLREQGFAHDFEAELHRGDGDTFTALMTITLREPTADDGTLLQGLIRDVTEQKRAREALQRSEERYRLLSENLERQVAERTAAVSAYAEELESFAYSVSHDLRAPLRAMDGFSEAVLEDYGDLLDDTGQDYLRRIRAASQRMGDLIDDLLQLSRVTRGELRGDRVDLSALGDEVVAELREADPERQVEFVVEPEMTADGDPRLLRSLLQNLLGNAWKFTARESRPRVELGRRDDDGDVVFFVRDNGTGFDARYADKLFKPFQRLHDAAEFEGNGIGLATVHRIARRHGGRAWAEGRVDEGATFFFTLAPSEPPDA